MWQIRLYDMKHFRDGNYQEMQLVTEVENEPEFGATLEINGKTYRCCSKSPNAHVLGVEEINFKPEPEEKYGDELICPYCGDKHGDAWELSADSDTIECGNCGSEIEYEREYTVSYTVRPVKMAEVVRL